MDARSTGQGSTEAAACMCVPGKYRQDTACVPCVRDTFCPGDGTVSQCHANIVTAGTGKSSVDHCLCEAGHKQGSGESVSCVPCAGETNHLQDGTFKTSIGNSLSRVLSGS